MREQVMCRHTIRRGGIQPEEWGRFVTGAWKAPACGQALALLFLGRFLLLTQPPPKPNDGAHFSTLQNAPNAPPNHIPPSPSRSL